MGHGEAVRLRHVVQVIGGDEAAGPGHVLDDDGGMSGDVLGHVPGDDPGVRVEAAPRGKTDDDPYGLPLVKLPGLRSAADHGEHLGEVFQHGGLVGRYEAHRRVVLALPPFGHRLLDLSGQHVEGEPSVTRPRQRLCELDELACLGRRRG